MKGEYNLYNKNWEFIYKTLKIILKRPLTSPDYKEFNGSEGIFYNYKNRNTEFIAYACAESLKKLILHDIEKDFLKRTLIFEYFSEFFLYKEIYYMNKYPDQIEIIVSLMMEKVTNPKIHNYNITKSINLTLNKKNNLSVNKELYAQKVKDFFNKFFFYIEKDNETAIMYGEKLANMICDALININNIESKANDLVEEFILLNIIPKNIGISLKSILKLSDIDLESENDLDDFLQLCCLNIKIVSKWFLNQYIKISKYNITNDYFYYKHNSDLKDMKISELLNQNWSIKDYVSNCYKLWDNTLGYEMPQEHRGDFQKRIEYIKYRPSTQRALLNSNNDFIGFWSMCPLFREFQKINWSTFLLFLFQLLLFMKFL
jgi:hypothetical protein